MFSHNAVRFQEKAGQSENNDRTTHFGFETVPESAKESKGLYEVENNVLFANVLKQWVLSSPLLLRPTIP